MKTFTEEQLKKALKDWGVADEDQSAFIAEMNGSEVPAEGGEPEPVIEDKEKVEEGKAEEPTEGGEPEVEEEPVTEETPETPVQDDSAYKQRIDALEAKINDLVSTLEGLSAANKRNEEIIGSLGKRAEEKQAPFGDIKSSQAKDIKSEDKPEDTMDFLGKLAGKR